MDKFEDLKGKTLTAIVVSPDKEEIEIRVADGAAYRLYHPQDCCESVSVEDVVGDLSDLIGTPLLQAEEAVSDDDKEPRPEGADDSWTWTFYKLATIKGSVTIRWLGSSNGYYSESVYFVRVPPKGRAAVGF